MESRFQISAIGSVRIVEKKYNIQIDQEYIPALTHLKGFSHLQILWWAHLTDSPQDRDTLIAENLFKKGPDQLGIFATRAPARPNPIMISTIKVTEIDLEEGIIQTSLLTQMTALRCWTSNLISPWKGSKIRGFPLGAGTGRRGRKKP